MAWLWLVIGVALAIAEVFTTTFVLVMFAAGAFAAAGAAAIGLPWYAQVLSFGAVSAAALALVRPAIQRHLNSETEGAPIGLAAIEGSLGLVLERVDLDHGLIKIEGEMWSARPYDATQVIEKGERVRIIEIKGATALVWRE
ncbi:NfeD family protein [Rugosimonospora africana]|uniref:NfeD family protein n=1 Tax=Rugosimonospora africana TaxID=556532 RepID=UPI001EF1E48B|nr:NfeD family protein [Rugosimonospora africana]